MIDRTGRKRLLSHCSIVLAPIGSQLFLSNQCFILVRWFLRMLFVGMIPIYVHRIWTDVNAKGMSLHILSLISVVVGAPAANLLLIMRREKLETFVTAHAERIPALHARKLARWINLFTAFVIMQVAVNLCMAVDGILIYEVHSLDWKLSIFRTASVFFNSWIMITCIFY